ncbi:hypothetical protein BsWGS_19063 [Bradybaena similaris]
MSSVFCIHPFVGHLMPQMSSVSCLHLCVGHFMPQISSVSCLHVCVGHLMPQMSSMYCVHPCVGHLMPQMSLMSCVHLMPQMSCVHLCWSPHASNVLNVLSSPVLVIPAYSFGNHALYHCPFLVTVPLNMAKALQFLAYDALYASVKMPSSVENSKVNLSTALAKIVNLKSYPQTYTHIKTKLFKLSHTYIHRIHGQVKFEARMFWERRVREENWLPVLGEDGRPSLVM